MYTGEYLHRRSVILHRLYGALLGITDPTIPVPTERFVARVRERVARAEAEMATLDGEYDPSAAVSQMLSESVASLDEGGR